MFLPYRVEVNKNCLSLELTFSLFPILPYCGIKSWTPLSLLREAHRSEPSTIKSIETLAFRVTTQF